MLPDAAYRIFHGEQAQLLVAFKSKCFSIARLSRATFATAFPLWHGYSLGYRVRKMSKLWNENNDWVFQDFFHALNHGGGIIAVDKAIIE